MWLWRLAEGCGDAESDCQRDRAVCRCRGAGPPVLLIMGATEDGGHFDVLADVLADEFTLVSYDRRGDGHSATPDELGDDLAPRAGP